MKKVRRIFGGILLVVATVFLGFAVWAKIATIKEIADTLVDNSITLTDIGLYEAAKYLMDSFASYLFYALSLIGIALLLLKKKKKCGHTPVDLVPYGFDDVQEKEADVIVDVVLEEKSIPVIEVEVPEEVEIPEKVEALEEFETSEE